MTVDFGAELCATSAALKEALRDEYGKYLKLIELFLSGRMTKEELEGGLRSILGPELHLYDLHNKYVGLVLERVAAAESVALAECQRQAAYGFEGRSREGAEWQESASLRLADVPISSVDQAAFEEAAKRSPVELPYIREDAERAERLRAELLAAEKALGRPLLCKFARALPDMAALRSLLSAWIRAYDLDATSLEDDHLVSILQGLADHLRAILEEAHRRASFAQSPPAGGSVVITDDLLLSTVLQLGLDPCLGVS